MNFLPVNGKEGKSFIELQEYGDFSSVNATQWRIAPPKHPNVLTWDSTQWPIILFNDYTKSVVIVIAEWSGHMGISLNDCFAQWMKVQS